MRQVGDDLADGYIWRKSNDECRGVDFQEPIWIVKDRETPRLYQVRRASHTIQRILGKQTDMSVLVMLEPISYHHGSEMLSKPSLAEDLPGAEANDLVEILEVVSVCRHVMFQCECEL